MGGWAGLLIVYPIVYEDTAFSLSCVLGRALVLVVSACGEQKIRSTSLDNGLGDGRKQARVDYDSNVFLPWFRALKLRPLVLVVLRLLLLLLRTREVYSEAYCNSSTG